MPPPKTPPTGPLPEAKEGAPGQKWDANESTDDVSNPGTPPGEDIYGEDEYPPEEDEEFEGSVSMSVSSTGTARGSATQGRTMVGPAKSAQPSASDDDGEDATRAGPPVRIEVLSGPDAGEVRRFKGVRMVVGRGSSCDFQLSDQSVSRKHLELVQSARGVLLRDLQSNNGTRVNSKRVSEVVVEHGDTIVLGATTLKFIDEVKRLAEAEEAKAKQQAESEQLAARLAEQKLAEAGALSTASSPDERDDEEDDDASHDDGTDHEPSLAGAPHASSGERGGMALMDWLKSKQGLVVVGSAVLLVVVVALVLGLGRSKPPPPDPMEERARKLLTRAKLAYDEERWVDAVDAFAQVERVKPGFEKDGFTALAQAELAAHQSLERARALIAQQRFDDARAELARTPQAGKKTQAEGAQLVSMLEALQAQALEATVAAALAKGDFAAAQQAASLLPPARQAAVTADIDAKRSQSEAQQAAETAREAQEREAREAEEAKRRMEDAMGAVSRKLNDGSPGRAGLECDRVLEKYGQYPDIRGRTMDLKRLIPMFERTWADGLRRAQSGSAEAAFKALERAAELYDQIGLPGALAADVYQATNAAAYTVAKNAMAREDWATAAATYRGVLDRTPGDDEAKAGLQRLEARAEDLYRFAYMVRDRDPRKSQKLLQAILDIVRPGSPVYEKARQELKRMDPNVLGGKR
ncbi:MAG: FHA domain-containing protein [Myxococcaceae bacterium]